MKKLPLALARLQKPSPWGLSPKLIDDLPGDCRDLLDALIASADTADGVLDIAALAPMLTKSPQPSMVRAAFQLVGYLYPATDEDDRPRYRAFLLRLFGVLGMSFFATVSAEMERPFDRDALLSAVTALMLADAETGLDVFRHAVDHIYNKRVIMFRDQLRQNGINSYLTALETLGFCVEAEEMLSLALSEMVEGCMQLSQINTSLWPLQRLRGLTAGCDPNEVAEDNAFLPLLPCLLWALELA